MNTEILKILATIESETGQQIANEFLKLGYIKVMIGSFLIFCLIVFLFVFLFYFIREFNKS